MVWVGISSRAGVRKAVADVLRNLRQGSEWSAPFAPWPVDDQPLSIRPVGESFSQVLTTAVMQSGLVIDPRTLERGDIYPELVDR